MSKNNTTSAILHCTIS